MESTKKEINEIIKIKSSIPLSDYTLRKIFLDNDILNSQELLPAFKTIVFQDYPHTYLKRLITKTGDYFISPSLQIQGQLVEGQNGLYLCQNKHAGADCTDKLGYAYSWLIPYESLLDLQNALDVVGIIVSQHPTVLKKGQPFTINGIPLKLNELYPIYFTGCEEKRFTIITDLDSFPKRESRFVGAFRWNHYEKYKAWMSYWAIIQVTIGIHKHLLPVICDPSYRTFYLLYDYKNQNEIHFNNITL